MPDDMTEAKKAILAGWERQRADLDMLINAMRRDLGMTAGETPRVEASPAAGSVGTTVGQALSVSEYVSPGDFLGMTQLQAMEEFLKRVGKSRPVTLQDIAAALYRGKATDTLLEGNKLKNLSSLLSRSNTFVSVARGRWGLTEWYPPRVILKREASRANGTEDAKPSDEGVK